MADFSSDELLVAQILLEFPILIQKSQFALGLTPAWPHRRKRSALQSPPPSPPPRPRPRPRPPPPPPLPSTSTVPVPAAVSAPSKKVKVSSPDSPLVINSLPYSRSESDDNPNAKRSRSIKKPSVDKKSQYVEAIDDLTKQNQGLKGEFEALKQHHNNLKSINYELNAIKQQIILCYKNQSQIPEIGTSSSSIVYFTGESSNRNEFQPARMMNYQQMGEQSHMNSQNFQIPIGAIPFYDPSIGPKGIPDLNIAFEEADQRNYARFLAAQARQNRIQICKNKNNGAAK